MRENKPMKLLSVAIPCYNSAAYMRNCIESLLPGGDEVEILIVDDGSTKDNTAEIADEYERNYPGICRAIHQENGGHGEAVNAGLRNATGVYYKVVDLSLIHIFLLGSKLKDGDRVVIIEDVTTSGKSIEETFPILKSQADVEIKGLMVSLNRMERGKGEKCALDEIKELYGFPTAAIVSMSDVVECLYNKECQGKVVIDDTPVSYTHLQPDAGTPG